MALSKITVHIAEQKVIMFSNLKGLRKLIQLKEIFTVCCHYNDISCCMHES